ncbi:MAG TPA: hypothetical protein VJ862_14230 [Rhodanobacteraceae bacterium]|nr:hypothetical protein [Rhodanobacteraceae bacterium]
MFIARRFASGLTIALFAVCAFAAELPRTKPDAVGLSSSRLEHINQVLRAKVDAGEIPGYVALVARHGKVAYYEALSGVVFLSRSIHWTCQRPVR